MFSQSRCWLLPKNFKFTWNGIEIQKWKTFLVAWKFKIVTLFFISLVCLYYRKWRSSSPLKMSRPTGCDPNQNCPTGNSSVLLNPHYRDASNAFITIWFLSVLSLVLFLFTISLFCSKNIFTHWQPTRRSDIRTFVAVV